MQGRGTITWEEREAKIAEKQARTRCTDRGRLGHWAGDDACTSPGGLEQAADYKNTDVGVGVLVESTAAEASATAGEHCGLIDSRTPRRERELGTAWAEAPPTSFALDERGPSRHYCDCVDKPSETSDTTTTTPESSDEEARRSSHGVAVRTGVEKGFEWEKIRVAASSEASGGALAATTLQQAVLKSPFVLRWSSLGACGARIGARAPTFLPRRHGALLPQGPPCLDLLCQTCLGKSVGKARNTVGVSPPFVVADSPARPSSSRSISPSRERALSARRTSPRSSWSPAAPQPSADSLQSRQGLQEVDTGEDEQGQGI